MYYSTFSSLNQVDLQNLMDPKMKQRPHESKFVKQLCYYIIVFILQIRRVKILISLLSLITLSQSISLSLTAVTLAMTLVKTKIGEDNSSRRTQDFTPSHVLIMLGVGWAAFFLALIFNLLYYVLHPSQVFFY